MKKNLTEIVFVLDRSGSMEHLTLETIGGYNSLIEKQKEENLGEAYVTTVLFDDTYTLLYDHVNLNNVPRLTKKDYYARGCTALLDAVGRTIDRIGERLCNTPENERPENILFIITTDGYENASREYTKSRLKEMITLQQNVYSWKFIFLGADIDAVGEADSIGIRSEAAYMPSATDRGISSSFNALGKIARFVRKSGSDKCSANFAAECYEAFKEIE